MQDKLQATDTRRRRVPRARPRASDRAYSTGTLVYARGARYGRILAFDGTPELVVGMDIAVLYTALRSSHLQYYSDFTSRTSTERARASARYLPKMGISHSAALALLALRARAAAAPAEADGALRPLEFSPADAERVVDTGLPWLEALDESFVMSARPEPASMRAGEAFLVPHSDREPAQIKPARLNYEARLGSGGVNNVYRVSYHANWAAGGFDPEKAAQCMRLLPVDYRKARNAHVIGGELFLRITEGRPIYKKVTQETHSIRIWKERWVLLHCGSGNIYYFKNADEAIGEGVQWVGWAELPKGGDAKGAFALAGSSMPAIGQYDNVRGDAREHAITFTEAADAHSGEFKVRLPGRARRGLALTPARSQG